MIHKPAITCERDHNLDVLRALAILMVVVFHVTQRWPQPIPWLYNITKYGEYGVDLFFVLSGWLIGRLLWREELSSGNIQIAHFLGRRIFRTMPAYFAALFCYSLAVRSFNGIEFDLRYLFFIQNYLHALPFFLISWSLCVEEHFYLIMPFVVLMIARHTPRPAIVILSLAVLPMLFRAMTWNPLHDQAFGAFYTASHLRFEGLLLGVWAAFLVEGRGKTWRKVQRLAPLSMVVSLVTTIFLQMGPEHWHYIFSYSTVAVFFVSLLLVVVGRGALGLFPKSPTYWVAMTSYSVYLTHAMALDVALRLVKKFGFQPEFYLSVLVGLILLGGAGFYFVVERPILQLRSWLLPVHSRSRILSQPPLEA